VLTGDSATVLTSLLETGLLEHALAEATVNVTTRMTANKIPIVFPILKNVCFLIYFLSKILFSLMCFLCDNVSDYHDTF
jgi:hypothetical protein